MENNKSFNVSGGYFKTITDKEFYYDSEYPSMGTSTDNPNVDPDEAATVNNKMLYGLYFFAALLAFLFIYTCCTAYYFHIKERIEAERRDRRIREERRRQWTGYRRRSEESTTVADSFSGFLSFNPVQRRVEEKTRQESNNRLSESVFGRDVPDQGRPMKETRRPSYMILDDISYDDSLRGATGISKSLNQIPQYLEESLEQEQIQKSLEVERRFREFVSGRDVRDQGRPMKETRRPSYMILDDMSYDNSLRGATGIGKSLNQIPQYLEESLEQEQIQKSFELERRFHELTPSRRPEKWSLREMFPTYFETDKNAKDQFPDMLNPCAYEPTKKYAEECKRQQRAFKTRDAMVRAHTVQENMEKEEFVRGSQDNTNLYAAAYRPSMRNTSYERQDDTKSKTNYASYYPPIGFERKFFCEDLLLGEIPQQSSSNDDAPCESSAQKNVKQKSLGEGSQEDKRQYASSTGAKPRILRHTLRDILETQGDYASYYPPIGFERKFSFDLLLGETPQQSSSNDDAPCENSAQKNVKQKSLGEGSQEDKSQYASSTGARQRILRHTLRDILETQGEYDSYYSALAKERKLYPDLLCARKSGSNDDVQGTTGSPMENVLQPSKTPKKACNKPKQTQNPSTNMNKFSSENLEIKPQSSPNRLVQSSPPPNILRRKCHRKRESPRRTSS